MAHVLAVVNMKGGVGKTATVVCLADALAARGKGPVLVVDVDTQASASYALAGDQILKELIDNKKTIDQFIKKRLVTGGESSLKDYIRRNISNTTVTGLGQLKISLVASSPTLRLSERDVVHHLTKKGLSLTGIEEAMTETLEEELEQLGDEFKYVIFDCAPGISPFTTAAVSNANLVIVPTIPDFLSFLGLDGFLNSVRRDLTQMADTRPPHVLITRSLARSKHGWMKLWRPLNPKGTKINHHTEYEALIGQNAKDDPSKLAVFKTMIDETPAIPNALSLGAEHKTSPTFQQKYPSPLNKVLEQLTKEIEEILR